MVWWYLHQLGAKEIFSLNANVYLLVLEKYWNRKYNKKYKEEAKRKGHQADVEYWLNYWHTS